MNTYQTVIGLEIHIQLATASKMFCGCSNTPTEPNLQTCPVCLGLPGALPVPNREAVRMTQRLAAALGAELREQSHFDRKHYYYPDLPKGYQISQYLSPLAQGGSLEVGDRAVRIERLHLEEDAGKNIHSGRETLVDLDRAGTPLVELVTEPDLTSAEEAGEFMRRLQALVRGLGVGEANMEKGELRVDANISLRAPGGELGIKVEVKNMNSFRFMEQAIRSEEKRQRRLLERDEVVTQETRGYVEKTGETVSQRSKEGAEDYRYLTEPDIPPLIFTPSELSDIQSEALAAVEVSRARGEETARRKEELLSAGYMIGTGSPYLTDAGFAVLKAIQESLGDEAIPKEVETLVLRSPNKAILLAHLTDLAETETITAYLIDAIAEMRLRGSARASLPLSGLAASLAYAVEHRLSSLEDAVQELGYREGADLPKLADEAIKKNPDAVSDYRSGNLRALDSLVGYSMKRSEGKADPATLRRLLEEKLKP